MDRVNNSEDTNIQYIASLIKIVKFNVTCIERQQANHSSHSAYDVFLCQWLDFN